MLRAIIFANLIGSLCAADFAREVAPLLESRCQLCHGAQQQMKDFRLDRPIPSEAGAKILERIRSAKSGFRMPPVGAALTAKEIAALESWIGAGAKWPGDYRPGGKSGHWAFQPLANTAPPAVKNSTWPRGEIDRFVLARLEKEGLQPSPEAARTVLLRRVSLDLTGLPPSTDEIRNFLADTQPGAYERVVDRLLASPRYGEKWARHWLDLAHYADSDGYEKDQVRPYAWRYRNWVIDALNKDVPFDQFTAEQLAGDLIPNATEEQRVATGFLRTTLTNREAGVDRAEDRFDQLLSRVNTTATTWLGLTVGCAQCHDHKYDPISNREFYQMMAFFDAAEEAEIEAPLPGERRRWEEAMPAYLASRGHILERNGIAELQNTWEDKLRAAIAKPGTDIEWDFSVTSMTAMFDRAKKVLLTDPAKRSWRDRVQLTDYFLSSMGPDFGRVPEIRERIADARQQITKLSAALPKLTMAMAVTGDAGYRGSHMRVKGDYRITGASVVPAGLGVLPPVSAAATPTRLDLARWLVSNDNPLTPRVIVNRAWQEFFGRGLVATSEDFGTQGERPTHPELLDHLARGFRDNGWSVKKLHRAIVTSATYRQSSALREEIAAKDPGNLLLARQSRLRISAELIRDSALTAAGLLDARVGGPSVRPPQPAGVAELGYGRLPWNESEGVDRYRRGLYVHFQRTTPYPQLMNFDAPESNVACSRRRTSNTPLQSLNLLNDPVFFEAAQSLAGRVVKQEAAFSTRLNNAFLMALGREPDTLERERLARYHDEQRNIFEREPQSWPKAGATKEEAAWTGVCRVLLNLEEFITRE
ncbi:MAG: DUF1553 domain-containing protein [Candidatus Solibacter usitatus]|nr:DUF1553 domain-containing protein [Candidatus Solibacter usitatus]